MRRSTYSKIKTINFDSDIFTQDNEPATSKLTLNMIKNLSDRKNKDARRYKSIMEKCYNKSITQKEENSSEVDIFNRIQIDHNYFRTEEIENEKSKTSSNRKYYTNKDQEKSFKRYSRGNSPVMNSIPDPELLNMDEVGKKEQVEKQWLYEIDLKEINKLQNKINFQQQKPIVNPYTKDQYIYMKNRHIDQIMQLKRSGKLRRISSIIKSYQVKTIQLTHQDHKRTVSFKLPTSPVKTTPKSFISKPNNRIIIKRQSDIKPSPWQWGKGQQSREQIL